MTAVGQDTLGTRETLDVGGKSYGYYSLAKAAAMELPSGLHRAVISSW